MRLIRGGAEIDKRLRQIPKKLQRRAVRKGLNSAAKPMVQQAKANTGSFTQTGAIRRGVKRKNWRPKFFADAAAIGVVHGPIPEPVGDGFGVNRSTRGKITIRKLNRRELRGEDPYYYKWVESGSVHNVARHFLRDAFTQRQGQAIRRYAQVLRKEVSRLGA